MHVVNIIQHWLHVCISDILVAISPFTLVALTEVHFFEAGALFFPQEYSMK